jgi:hypothetical protein
MVPQSVLRLTLAGRAKPECNEIENDPEDDYLPSYRRFLFVWIISSFLILETNLRRCASMVTDS